MIRSSGKSVCAASVWMLAAALLLSFCTSTRAAMPQLPAEAITQDTICVIYLNGPELTPEKLRQAAAAVIGPQLKADDAGIAKYTKSYEAIKKDGADSAIITMPYIAPDGAGGEAARGAMMGEAAVIYVHLKPDANEDALREEITEDLGLEKTRQFTRTGDFLVIRDKTAPPVAAPSAARAKSFADAFATIARTGEKPITIMLVPTEKSRLEMTKQLQDLGQNLPPAVADLLTAIGNGKWGAATLTLGESPLLAVTVEAADAASADALVAKEKAGLDQMKNMGQGNAKDPGSQILAAMLQPLLGGIKITEDSPRVTVSLDLKTLSFMGGGFGVIATYPTSQPGNIEVQPMPPPMK